MYLLARRSWASGLMIILAVGFVYGLVRVFGAKLDPSLISGGELCGEAITTGGVRIVTPFFNVYGTLTLVGGAAYSAWVSWRRRVLPQRAIGNILIAVGAMAPACGGALSRFGLGGYLYLGELVGAILMFIGFNRATAPSDTE